MDFDITKEPPTEAEIKAERIRLKKKIKVIDTHAFTGVGIYERKRMGNSNPSFQNKIRSSKYRFTEFPTLPAYDIDLQKPEGGKPDDLSIIRWVIFYLEKSPSSIETDAAKKQDLQKFLNYFCRMNPEGTIQGWAKGLTIGFRDKLKKALYKTASTRRIMATLLTFSKFLENNRVMEYNDNPVRGVKLPRKSSSAPKSLVMIRRRKIVQEGRPVLRILLQTARNEIKKAQKQKSSKRAYRDYAILSTLYYGNLRVTELCGLLMAQKEPDPDTDGIVFREVKCKGEKTRDVFIAASGARAIEDYIEKERGNKAGPLFLAAPSLFAGKKKKRGIMPLSRSGVWRILKRLAAKARISVEGIDDIPLSPHMLRHERAYSLKKAGFSDTDLAEELGHSGTGYVGVYTKRSEQARFKRLNRVG